MVKERYRLQALLTIKAREKRQTEIALAAAIKELNEAREKEKELEKKKEEIIEKIKVGKDNMLSDMGAGSSIFDGTIHSNFLKSLEEDKEAKEKEIEEQKEVVAEAEEAVSGARRDYIDAAKELQVMEKHKDLWRKKIENEINKREEKELNELGNTIHQLRRWKGEGAGI